MTEAATNAPATQSAATTGSADVASTAASTISNSAATTQSQESGAPASQAGEFTDLVCMHELHHKCVF